MNTQNRNAIVLVAIAIVAIVIASLIGLAVVLVPKVEHVGPPPPPSPDPGWELVGVDHPEPSAKVTLERTTAPGGWLYRATYHESIHGERSIALSFVPATRPHGEESTAETEDEP